MTRLCVVALCASLLGCGAVGNGNITTEQRTVDAFARISVASGIETVITLGTRDISLTTDENVLPLVETYLEGDLLVVRVRPDRAVTTAYGIRAVITNDRVEGLNVSGGSHVDATASAVTVFAVTASGGSPVKVSGIASTTVTSEASGASTLELAQLAATTLSLDGSGGSTVSATGSATAVTLVASGASHLDTDGVTATSVQLDGSGGSDLKTRASGSAKGSLSGASQATIAGSPGTRDVSTSGGSTVTFASP